MTGKDIHSVEVRQIIQIRPDCKINPMFGACLAVVSEVKSWGVQCYVHALGENGKPGGLAHIKLPWEEFESTAGRVVWVRADPSEGEDAIH
jgi:hypothetical protein